MGNCLQKARRKDQKQIREPAAADLPTEILLLIFARADPVTLVRCAATSKLLRSRIADPSFLRLHHADVGGRFSRSVLLGVFQQHRLDEVPRFAAMPASTAKLTLTSTPAPTRNAFGSMDAMEAYSEYTLLASRGGLVLLQRRHTRPLDLDLPAELCVCNPMAGTCRVLPHATVFEQFDYLHRLHALLPGDDDDDVDGDHGLAAHSSFRLLVARLSWSHCVTQTFSSRTGVWGAATEETTPPAEIVDHISGLDLVHPTAVVLRGVAHWLYNDRSSPRRCHVGAVGIDTGRAALIEVPLHCLHRLRVASASRADTRRELLLASSADGRLSLVVAEILAISMWTLTTSSSGTTWARQVVVSVETMQRSVKLQCHPVGCVDVELEWFGETCGGTVVLQLHGAGILLLNLRTKEVSQFSEGLHVCRHFRCCPYEIDLVSLLASMKSF